jgi:hypothetical protein
MNLNDMSWNTFKVLFGWHIDPVEFLVLVYVMCSFSVPLMLISTYRTLAGIQFMCHRFT